MLPSIPHPQGVSTCNWGRGRFVCAGEGGADDRRASGWHAGETAASLPNLSATPSQPASRPSSRLFSSIIYESTPFPVCARISPVEPAVFQHNRRCFRRKCLKEARSMWCWRGGDAIWPARGQDARAKRLCFQAAITCGVLLCMARLAFADGCGQRILACGGICSTCVQSPFPTPGTAGAHRMGSPVPARSTARTGPRHLYT